ncbi:hypothetical protein DPEC_G00205740 [Dallia pectoralis]|uniref:Uncharacterized protein n=1 Tax=Dallia pectoralis TaxID=75939 RepID=A0ACC2G4F2_DALPE|nr:hypothetical protein DPEC_G00205740 [Dallia pectoralis]
MVQPVKVYTPYVPDTAQLCRNGTTEYYSKRVSLCCSRCKPGTRMTVECSANSDTVCQPCPKSQYINTFHFTSKCFRCSRCSEDKGLRYVHYCTSSTNALCACKPGMYCRLGRNPECMECASYKSCEPGSGVSEHETDDSDVTCTPCPFGTFSNKHSYNQTCQQHTDCKSQGRHPLTDGNATSDVTCGPELNESQTTTTPSQLTTPPSDRLITPTEGIPPGFDPRIVAGVITSLLLLVIGGMFLCKKVFCQPRRASSTEEDSQKAVLKLDSDGPLTIRYSSIKAFCQEKMYLLEDGTKPSLPETQQVRTGGFSCFCVLFCFFLPGKDRLTSWQVRSGICLLLLRMR